ncbi:LrgB family protein [Marinobacterium jannaschii]|uniref:LrgB family protein n=1 Tax=Marinobacterium jannaschii TaxID=64970 RepID=UPI0004805533|nr:LrgB family protein [Marinobacterium jannaschii]
MSAKPLLESPLLWITLTLAVFCLAVWINRKAGRSPFLHPVLVSLSIIILILLWLEVPYQTYFSGAQFLHFMMGPAIVALAIPLYDNRQRVRRLLLPVLSATLTGAVTAAVSAVVIGYLSGADRVLMLTLAPKSVTSPIAIGIAEKIGAEPSLAAGLVLITGALSCLFAPFVFRLLRLNDHAARGFTLGVSGHAMGTAYAFEYSALAGAFGGLAMGLAGAFTAFFLPVLLPLLDWLPG